MRPQQQGRRPRNRGSNNNNNNNNRRNQNPLSRSYESNGPDIKIRGNPQVIADKYNQLARDATSAGDPVMAENYLQHAEHYTRIIMAATPVQQQRDDDDQSDDAENNDDANQENGGSDNPSNNGQSNNGQNDSQSENNRNRNRNNRNRNRDNNRDQNRENEIAAESQPNGNSDPVNVEAPANKTEAPAASEPEIVALQTTEASTETVAEAPKKRAPRKPRVPKEAVAKPVKAQKERPIESAAE